jgi:hypothetical protein
MKNLQMASCKLGAKGWLFWTWDTGTTTSLASQNLFYSLADSRGWLIAGDGELPGSRTTRAICSRTASLSGAADVTRPFADDFAHPSPSIPVWTQLGREL